MTKKRKHTPETLYNGECQTCGGKAHSKNVDPQFVDLPDQFGGSIPIIFTESVCVGCGPQLKIELPEKANPVLDEALKVLGYDKDKHSIIVEFLPSEEGK